MHNPTGLDKGVFTASLAMAMVAFASVASVYLVGAKWLILQAKLQAAVDLAALAAADSYRGLVSGPVCENADQILQTLDARLTTCRIVGTDVHVEAEIFSAPIVIRAGASAGPPNA